MRSQLLVALTLAVASTMAPVYASSGEPMNVTGKLTNDGVECQAMRSDDGKLYTLIGDLKGFRNGDRVKVTGSIAEVSFCMQGTTIKVEKIERAN